jgi:outer membrane protein OmpA-like peptidoglycan-associated protein
MNFQANQFKYIASRLRELEDEQTGAINATPIDDDLNVFRIYFDSKSAAVRNQDDVIERIVHCIRSRTKCKITINGHTDRHGYRQANMNLGAERALAVGAELMVKGIAGADMEFQSFGSTVPRLTHSPDTDDADRDNRRVEIILG